MPFPDLDTQTQQTPTIAAQQMAAAATVHGTGVDVSDCEAVEMEMSLGSLAGSPTGGTITMTPEHSDDNSTFVQVNSDTVVANYNDTLPEVKRYRYIGDSTVGKKRYVRFSVTTALTGGTSPTIDLTGNILKGGLRLAGKMPQVGSAPQTPSGGLTN